jgi:hypothetical protein
MFRMIFPLRFHIARILPLVVIGTALAASASATDLVVNGDFETGLSGWTTASQVGTAFDPSIPATAGYIAVGSGYIPPSVGYPVLDPFAGASYALGDATAAGAYALIQDFTLPSGTTSVSLSFASYIYDWSGQTTVGNGFDYTSGLNQHVQVDILKGGSADFTTSAGDVVASLFAGGSSDPSVAWSLSNYDLTSSLVAGQTYRLRFATVASTFVISHGIDDVSLDVQAVPEPMTVFVLGLPALALVRRRRSA